MEDNLPPYENIEPTPQVEAQDQTQEVDELELLRQQNRELNKHLKDALLINHVFASCIEIMGETHLTKNEKYNIIRNLNEAITVDEVDIKTKALKDSMGISDISEDFRKDQSEDDSFWSNGFRNELKNYFAIHSGIDIREVMGTALVDIDNYFQLLSQYANAQEQNDQERINQITQQILDQEPKARAGLSQMKRLGASLNLDQS